jgi:hypothetical protein
MMSGSMDQSPDKDMNKVPFPIQDNIMSPDAFTALSALLFLGRLERLPDGYGFNRGSGYRISCSLADELELHGYIEIDRDGVTISEIGRTLLLETFDDGSLGANQPEIIALSTSP